MKAFINAILLIVGVISFVGTALFILLYDYCEIMGAPSVNKLLEKLHIPLNYDQIFIIGCICCVVMILSQFLRAKLTGKPFERKS